MEFASNTENTVGRNIDGLDFKPIKKGKMVYFLRKEIIESLNKKSYDDGK